MTYHYFVSYSHTRGTGMTEISTNAPLDTFAAVVGVARTIEDNSPTFDRGDVVIVNYVLMRKVEA